MRDNPRTTREEKNKMDTTPTEAADQLADCVFSNDIEGVLKLLEAGIDPNIKDGNTWTALIWASDLGREAIVKLLLDHKSDVNIQDDHEGYTPLIRASYHGHEGVVKLLLDHEANPDTPANNGDTTALVVAAEHGHIGIVKLLLDRGADSNIQHRHYTPAITNALLQYEELANALLEYGPDPDSQDEDVIDVIDRIERYKAIVKLLLEYDADLTIKTNEGLDTYDYVGDKAKELLFLYEPSPDRFMENAVTRTIHC